MLANRLTENGKYSVLLLEAGGSDLNLWIQMPIGYGKAFYNKRINWMYLSEPEAGLNGQRSYWPRGKVMGGSSSINAMVYIRGQQEDFDEWEAQGNTGWGWKDVLPYFKKSEQNSVGGNEFRGDKGPLYVSDMSRDLHPLCQKFIKAGEECGYPFNPDFNGATQDGVGLYQNTAKDGFRMSASRAYLSPARKRSNLRVEKQAHATRVLFEGKKAVGIEYEQKGKVLQAFAHREVILSAGAVNSPQLLQLSGVGCAKELAALGIEIVKDAPAVGSHLQDHLAIDYLYRSRVPTLNDQLRPLFGKLRYGLQYVLTRRGPLSLGVNQAGGFIRSRADLARPDMQLFFSPVSYTKAPPGERPLMNPDPFSGFLLSIQPTQPKSRGRIRLKSADPFEHPAIQPNYFSDKGDLEDMYLGARILRKIASAPAMSSIIEQEILPGGNVHDSEGLREDIKNRSGTVFHPVSTCRMGTNSKQDVVTPRLNVYGLKNLRVVDASIFPTLTSGNTNAPVIMAAEKGADMILEDHA